MELAYDGTAYHGWQIQPNALSVQEVIEKALFTYFRSKIEITGCGRTDTGVHALKYFAHFDLEQRLYETYFKNTVTSLNALLPWDISIHRIIKVKHDAHARFDASLRSYEYHIHFQKNPFKVNRSMWFKDSLDVTQMNDAAQLLLYHSDFSCFSKSNTQTFTNNCTIEKAYFEKTKDGLIFHITANRFLRNMVRAIVGTLLEVGRNKWQKCDVQEILQSKNRSKAGQSVPASGLYLSEIKYPYLND